MKILIVDDNIENRALLRHLVKKQGHDSIEACNGQKACEFFEQHPSPAEPIDLVLMDVMMPVMDGLAATKLIKQRAGEHHVAIIFVTALSDTETLNQCLNSGGDDYISKPINATVLNAKLTAHQRVIDVYRRLEHNNEQLRLHELQTRNDHYVVEKMFQQAMKRNTLGLQGFHYYLSPLSLFNGDVLLISEHPERGVYLFVGDFTGHGLTAAMGSLPVSEIFFAMTQKGLSIGDIAAEMDTRLRELLPVTMFCCAVLLNLDKSRRQLNAWIGGMDSFFIMGNDGTLRRETSEHHLPLGVHWGDGFSRSVLQMDMREGDRIFCYTDGITEATNEQGDMFGIERLQAFVSSHPQVHVDHIVAEVQRFCGASVQRDDITLAELICQSTPKLVSPLSETEPATPLHTSPPLVAASSEKPTRRFH